MKTTRLILASASPRRAELLKQLGVRFRVRASEIPELAAGHLAPHEICLSNAAAKARMVARLFPVDLILAADTEVALGARVMGKPRNRRQAAEFLAALSGRTHQVITGVCLMSLARRFRISFVETTHVTFQPLDSAQISRYLRRINPLDKAGAYAVQEGGEMIIESIEGSLTNIVGLPLGTLRETAKQLPADLQTAFNVV